MSHADSIPPEDAEALQKLVRLVTSADGFALFIVSTVSESYQRLVAEALVASTPEMSWQQVHLGPGTESVLDACLAKSSRPPVPLIITGFDEAAPDREAMRQLMTGLNYSRPRWKPNLDVPVVMVVGPEAHQAMLEFAPDFARYRSATVRFLATPALPEGEAVFMPWLTLEQRRERMNELRRQLREGARLESDADRYARVEREWELALHRLAVGEPPRFERAVWLASTLSPPRLPEGGRSLVQSLNLDWISVSDLSLLAELTELRTLRIFGSPASDLSPLAELTALQTLSLRGMNVSDLSPLVRLTALRNLNLWGTNVSDLSWMARLTALQTLYLGGTSVSDLSSVAELNSLQTLSLSQTKVSDLSPLAGLTAVRVLNLWGTKVTEISPLAGLTALRRLNLRRTRVSDLSPLAGLTMLRTLSLSRTKVTDLSPLERLIALRKLYLQGTRVADLSPLPRLTALQTLSLSQTKVTDLSPLAGLTALRNLNLRSTQVSDFSPLQGLPKLTEVILPSGREWNPQQGPPEGL